MTRHPVLKVIGPYAFAVSNSPTKVQGLFVLRRIARKWGMGHSNCIDYPRPANVAVDGLMRSHEPGLYQHSLHVGKIVTDYTRFCGLAFETACP